VLVHDRRWSRRFVGERSLDCHVWWIFDLDFLFCDRHGRNDRLRDNERGLWRRDVDRRG
jgi:hypothetical protein